MLWIKTNYFRFKKIDENDYLITNKVWWYLILSKDDFKRFLQKDFSQASDLLSQLEDKWFIWEELEKTKENPIWPRFHNLIITLRCNHLCTYCHASVEPLDKIEFDMTQETARKIVDTIFSSTAPEIVLEFNWGEPLLNWKTLTFIVDYSKEKNVKLWKKVRYFLVTNTTLFTDEKLQYLIDNDFSISVSLDWLEIIHNSNRTYKYWNSYQQTVGWIKKINNAYKDNNRENKVTPMITITNKALPLYKEIIDNLISLGMSEIFIRPLEPLWYGSLNMDSIWYKMSELKTFYSNFMDYIVEKNLGGSSLVEVNTLWYIRRVLAWRNNRNGCWLWPCWAWVKQLTYNYNWEIYTCNEARALWKMWDKTFMLQTVTDDGQETYQSLYKQKKLQEVLAASIMTEKSKYAAYIPYLWVCPVYNHKINGAYVSDDVHDVKLQVDAMILDYIFDKIRDKKTFDLFNKWLSLR